MIDPELERYWMPVDLYVGGAEHAVLHLLYARFWHKVLHDLGVVGAPEPFQRLVSQGMILGETEYSVYRDAEGRYTQPEAPGTPRTTAAALPVLVQYLNTCRSLGGCMAAYHTVLPGRASRSGEPTRARHAVHGACVSFRKMACTVGGFYCAHALLPAVRAGYACRSRLRPDTLTDSVQDTGRPWLYRRRAHAAQQRRPAGSSSGGSVL